MDDRDEEENVLTGDQSVDSRSAEANTVNKTVHHFPSMPDVSVVIASYQGASRIEHTLKSLAKQTLAADRFEVIVVVNGADDDGTVDLLREMRAVSFPAELRIITTNTPNAANARNLALAAARGTYVTFVDDDDQVSKKYLAGLLKYAQPGSVAMAPIADTVQADQYVADFDNYLNQSSLNLAGSVARFAQVPVAAAANAGKMVLTRHAREHLYPTHLSSGEDVVFWATLIASKNLNISVLPAGTGAVYRRLVRETSVSRSLSPTFVEDRLEIIKILRQLAQDFPEQQRPLDKLVIGQTSNIARYLLRYPEQRMWVLDRIREKGIEAFPYQRLNSESTDELVVAYAFPPYADTSAMVVARRLCLARQPVDVLTHAMDKIRSKDELSMGLVEESVGTVMTVGGPAVFANWKRIAIFADVGYKLVEERIGERGRAYRTVYSRTMWPAAHIMAALFKVRNPSVRWRAEFSDPMRIDSEGNVRTTEIPDGDPVFEEIENAIRSRGFPGTASRNMWEWVENIAYALADEIIYTNVNQKQFMLEHATQKVLADRAASIASVERHPTLPQRFYELEHSSYVLPSDRINIGYFGVFYKVRGVGDLLSALEALSRQDRSNVMLHVFTNTVDETKAEVRRRGLSDCVVVQAYIPYLEFLELSRHFDWLVVTDARVGEVHGINPYLPSKYSDYVGSGAKIWSIVEPGSVLSTIEVDAMTELGDVAEAKKVLAGLQDSTI
ncbi:Glycosyltransferase involved in cell wall bisynthesis [Micrococcales bacterium KH10]|nr:Glycosyltransferase involved in cell wall bisynthesis [Micrococcales bacterium KH10]